MARIRAEFLGENKVNRMPSQSLLQSLLASSNKVPMAYIPPHQARRHYNVRLSINNSRGP